MIKPLSTDIKLVNQRTDCDCTIACMAMITGMPYEWCEEQLKINADGKSAPYNSEVYMPFLVQNGIYPQNMTGNPWSHLYKGVYLVSVCSLNLMNRTHVVIMTIDDDNEISILDPQANREGKNWLTGEDYNTERLNVAEWLYLFDCRKETTCHTPD